MSDPAPRSKAHLARKEIEEITQARLTFGARGRAVATRSALQFSLDYAQARAAVEAALDVESCTSVCQAAGRAVFPVTSAAATRETFVKRPDLGRVLPEEAAQSLSAHGPCDVALVLGDGLSAIAANLNGPAFLLALAAKLEARGLALSPIILAEQARVALGDGIARALGARTVVVALGERPGLSAADSLGVYITQDPKPDTRDSARNCISNIRDAGLSVHDAALQADRLIQAMWSRGVSGVALSQALALGKD
ncbi:MAG: ethanolamine ammonia-lyase subunit EutC [Pseudomonadota bacterium]